MSNPYIDYNLLRCQSQFSVGENKRFEYRHTVSLKSTDISCTENTKLTAKQKIFIKFKWKDTLNNKYECDTKHLLYLIYLSLIKVEERQQFKNKYYLQINRNERVLKLLDKEEIITNLITYYQKDIINNKLDGELLSKLGPKDFINNILTKYGGKQCTLGWSTKIYAKLNEITIDSINGNVLIPNHKFNKLKCDIIQWDICSDAQITNLLQFAFQKTEKYFYTKNYALKHYENDLVQFWIHQKQYIQTINKMNQMDLMEKINNYLNNVNRNHNHNNNHNETKLQMQMNKVVDILLTECDLNDIL